MPALFRNPLLRLLRQLWWLPTVLFVLLVGASPDPDAFSRTLIGLAAALAFVAGMVGTAMGHEAWAAARERMRHADAGHRFLCSHCLRLGPIRFGCGACGKEVEGFIVHTGGTYVNDCPHCGAALLARDGSPGSGVAAFCMHCGATHARDTHHERRVRVLATLTPSDFTVLSEQLAAVPRESGEMPFARADDGRWLTYVLGLSRLPRTDGTVPADHALRQVEAVWLEGADVDALALGVAADRFARQSGLSDAERERIPVCTPARALKPAARNLLATRFGPLQVGIPAAAMRREIGLGLTTPHSLERAPGELAMAPATEEALAHGANATRRREQ